MYRVFLVFIWCTCARPGFMQTTSWDLVTSPPIVFGGKVELRCTFQGSASCCTGFSRIWIKGVTQVMNSGSTTLPSKYSETIDSANNQFSLIISNLDKDDVDVSYSCTYLSTPVQKTLTQNDSFEYHPTESCPVKLENGELVGTLNVNMSAPRPSVTAKYGNTNLTSDLTTTINPVTGRPKFFTINSSLKKTATCFLGDKFTLSVLTGVTTTIICNNVDFCSSERIPCGFKNFGYSAILPVVLINCAFVGLCLTGCSNSMKMSAKVVVLISCIILLCVNLVVSVLIGYQVVNCIHGTDPAFILLGLLPCFVGGGVYYILKFMCKSEKTWLTVFRVFLLYVITFGLYCLCSKGEKPDEDKDSDPGDIEHGKNASSSVPTVQIKKKQYVVRPGMTETLECTFNSTSPVTQVFWERTNDGTKTIIPNTTDQEKNLGSTPRIPSLTIRDIEKSDAGTYRCVATNSAGNGYSSATKLIVTESSGVIAIYGIKDSKIIFVCPYKSTTSTSVLWSCDDTEISVGPKITDSQRKDRVFIVGDHKAGVYNLELSGLQESDEGVYICNVGKQKQEYKLKVVAGEKHNK